MEMMINYDKIWKLNFNKTKSIYVGIDPSYTNTGIAFIDTDGGYGFKSIKFKRNSELFERLKLDKKEGKDLIKFFIKDGVNWFVKEIADVVSLNVCDKVESRYKVKVGIEIAMFSGSRTYQIALLVGALYQEMSGREFDVSLINVSSIRSLLSVPAKISSVQKKKYIKTFWGKLGAVCDDTDQSDALSVAYYLFYNDRGGSIIFKERAYG